MKRTTHRLFGLAILLNFQLLTLQPAVAQTNITVLQDFTGIQVGGGWVYPNGALPMGALVADTNGILYGTTEIGGSTNAGTVFRISSDGSGFTLLKSFTVNDAAYPFAGLLLSTEGVLFGTTYGGGTSNQGAVFRLSRDGSGFAVLHNFLGGSDGGVPEHPLIEGSDGALYGTTTRGNGAAQGTIFKVNKDGSGYSVIFAFPGFSLGVTPHCKLVEGSDGMLYGTASAGGSPGGGVVFAASKDGSTYYIIHDFGASGDGAIPDSGLIEASDGALYGTTYAGGAGNMGTVYKINKDGSGYVILRSFTGTTSDGANPQSELIESSDGLLYGAAKAGGAGLSGAVYKMSKDGTGFSILRSFFGPSLDGSTPSALMQLANGAFYGTSQYGGGDVGTVYAVTTVPLPPRILSQALSGNSNALQFAVSPGIQYDLLRSTNLVTWEVLAASLFSTGTRLNFSDTNAPQPVGFYRLRQQ